jgi:pyrroline-5-carboxylate reductase
MAAGVSIAKIEAALNDAVEGSGDAAKIIRIMPNLPARVGAAMTSMSRNANVDDDAFALAKTIFDSVGRAEEVPEDMIDCVIGVSGSSPAYTYMYIEALAKAAEANGMEKDKARVFACQAVIGAAKMALESKESLEQLRINVCSPGGTTIEAVKKLQTILVSLGYDLGKNPIDGEFGTATAKAVKAFQQANGLEVDGIVGPKTWAALLQDPVEKVTVTIPGLTREQANALITEYPNGYINA